MTAVSAQLRASVESSPTRRAARSRKVIGVVGLLGAHALLGMAMSSLAIVATAHAIATALAALFYAATTRRVRNVAIVASYVAGCEVLWRMDRAEVFYEFGKYTVAAVLIIAMLRMRPRRNRVLALSYLALLVPSVIMTFSALDPSVARQEVAFNMSGPATIAIAIIFFSNIRLDPNRLKTCFVAFIGPVAGIAAVLLLSTLRSEAIDFDNASNYVTSGSFGPNQVSAMLGLAVLFLVLISLERRMGLSVRIAALALAALFAAQSALTFARGGIGLALAGTLGAVFVLMRGSRRARFTVVMVALVSIVVGKYVVEPRLDTLTQGKLGERYSSTKTSGRELFISSEIEMFEEHPFLGVGPGVGKEIRDQRELHAGPSHTEYTRMIAEHGILGLASLICLVMLIVRAMRQEVDRAGRALSVALLIWAGLFLMIYGTRLVAPAVVLGMMFANRSAPPTPRTTSLG